MQLECVDRGFRRRYRPRFGGTVAFVAGAIHDELPWIRM